MTSEFREGTKMQKRPVGQQKATLSHTRCWCIEMVAINVHYAVGNTAADTTKVEKKHDLGPTVKFEIDEVDGNPGNHADWNLRLLCRTCNLAMGCGGCGDEGEGGIRELCVGCVSEIMRKLCKRRRKTTRGARREDRAEENAKAREQRAD